MRRNLLACLLACLCGSGAACSPPFAIFEDVGTDPHPPEVQLLGIAYQPEDPGDGPAPEPAILPADGFEVRLNDATGTTMLLRVQYADAGGDLVSFSIRDRDGTMSTSIAPTAPEVDLDGDGEPDTVLAPDYFTGTGGVVDLESVSFGSTMPGPHRMELWAVDSHESRSEKVTFTINVVL